MFFKGVEEKVIFGLITHFWYFLGDFLEHFWDLKNLSNVLRILKIFLEIKSNFSHNYYGNY